MVAWERTLIEAIWNWPRLGRGPDGQILAIEATPATALHGIMWGPAQVRFYAKFFASWAHATPTASEIIDILTEQRVRLGLSTQKFPDAKPITVMPILAIGGGKRSPQAMPRANAVREVIDEVPAGKGVGEPEVWTLTKQVIRPTGIDHHRNKSAF